MFVNSIKELNQKLETGLLVPEDQLAVWIDTNRIDVYTNTISNEPVRDTISYIKGRMQSGYRFISDFTAERVTAIRGYFDRMCKENTY